MPGNFNNNGNTNKNNNNNKVLDHLNVLRATLDSKLTFEAHLH